jgi:hypothetical protein
VALLPLLVLLAGCATMSQNNLPQTKRDALRIDRVDVSFAPNAYINWPDVFRTLPQSGHPDTNEGRFAFLEKRSGGRIRSLIESQVKSAFRGTEPARLKVVIRRLEVPSLVQRILIGGENIIAADITLTDGKTGQVLLTSDFTSQAYAGGGLGAVAVDVVAEEAIVRVSTNFGRALAQWLKTGQAFIGN